MLRVGASFVHDNSRLRAVGSQHFRCNPAGVYVSSSPAISVFQKLFLLNPIIKQLAAHINSILKALLAGVFVLHSNQLGFKNCWHYVTDNFIRFNFILFFIQIFLN
ncbi:hypothetical protein B9K06_15705 [Bacillus sp. OG2]|nr:hypothetical protein B9K06_15705 [Bacillus sp. OG2]